MVPIPGFASFEPSPCPEVAFFLAGLTDEPSLCPARGREAQR